MANLDRFAFSKNPMLTNPRPPAGACIGDYRQSFDHDVALSRAAADTPSQADIFGYFYEIDGDSLTRVTEDWAPVAA